jgi:hydrogenase maturation protease HycI
MSSASWQTSYQTTKKRLSQQRSHNQQPNQPERPLRLALVGIGHELRGDDAAGVLVARGVQEAWAEQEHLLCLDAGSAPENCTSRLRRFGPDLVLLVDAAYLDESPGAVRWLHWSETSGLSASTHTLPPYLLARYLTEELGCEVALLGIQPADMWPGAGVSEEVQRAVEEVVGGLEIEVATNCTN